MKKSAPALVVYGFSLCVCVCVCVCLMEAKKGGYLCYFEGVSLLF